MQRKVATSWKALVLDCHSFLTVDACLDNFASQLAKLNLVHSFNELKVDMVTALLAGQRPDPES